MQSHIEWTLGQAKGDNELAVIFVSISCYFYTNALPLLLVLPFVILDLLATPEPQSA